MAKAQKKLKYKLVNIHTEQFAIIDNVYKEGVEISVNATLGYQYSADSRLIKVLIKNELFQNERLFLIIEVASIFETEPESWEMLFDSTSEKITLPKKFAAFLATFSMNTTRGILHAKTEGSLIHPILLPLTTIHDIIKDDVIIEK